MQSNNKSPCNHPDRTPLALDDLDNAGANSHVFPVDTNATAGYAVPTDTPRNRRATPSMNTNPANHNASNIAAALGDRAEDVCRRYLPRGRKQGRYWTAGDVTGTPGRSLFVRLAPPGQPGKWTDAATGQHGDLLDLIRLYLGSATLGPALVAAVTASACDQDDTSGSQTLSGVHRTWLDPEQPAKADVARPRKALGRVHGLAARFGTPADGATLVAGEGIETVLSIVTAIPTIAAAATLSAGSLAAFAPPGNISRLVIARDNDDEGARAAAGLVERCQDTAISIAVIVPERADFNDDLIALGPQALADRITPFLR